MDRDTAGLSVASTLEASAPTGRSRAPGHLRPPTPWLAEVEPGRLPGLERLPAHADVLVVGGGVIGIAVAYWLARMGAAPLLLESRLPGWGASGRNAGLVLGSPTALETVKTVLAEEAIEAGYHEPGHLALAASDAALESFHRELSAARSPTATPLHLLDRPECEQLLGMRIGARFLAGRWMPLAGALHPARFLYGLAAAAIRRGAAVATRCRVLRIGRAARGDGWEVATERGHLRARRLVLACNAWSASLWPPLARVLFPTRGQVLATRPIAPLFRPAMAVDYGTLYWRQTADGSVVLGGYGKLDPIAERSAREALNPRIQAALEQFLPEGFPDVPPVAVASRWAGIMDETPDGRPLMGKWPDDSGLWVAAGFGGHGLPPALGAGRELAREILEGSRSAELNPMDPGRYRQVLGC